MQPHPTATPRIALLDVARGLAILGTLGTNIWMFTLVGFDVLLPGAEAITSADGIITRVSAFLTNGKFLGLLTILFGVGVEIQYRSAQRRGTPWPRAYLWRSLLLFVDGIIHYVFVFEADILMGYAVAAVIVAVLIGRSEKVQRRAMWIAGSLHLTLVAALSAFDAMSARFEGVEEMHPGRLEAVLDRGENVFDQTYLEQVASRLELFLPNRAEAIGIIPMSVFLYFVGIRLMRAGVFEPTEQGRAARRRLLSWGLGIGVPLNLLGVANPLALATASRYLFAPVMALGYLGLVAWIVDAGRLRRAQTNLAAVGRTALSCYMLQNVVASVLFYRWGLGLVDHVDAVGTLAVYAFICALLIVAARLWLRRFPTGPFEMVWRRLSALPFERDRRPQHQAGTGTRG